MITKSRVVLRDKNAADAWDDYAWETDPELAELDAAPVIQMSYSRYLMNYNYELQRKSPTSRMFGVDTRDGRHIGNCSYYNLDLENGDVELGIMIGNRDYWNKGYGADTITALVEHIFNETGVDRIHLKTLESNVRAQKCFEKCGFAPCGHLSRFEYDFLLMELHRQHWEKMARGQ